MSGFDDEYDAGDKYCSKHPSKVTSILFRCTWVCEDCIREFKEQKKEVNNIINRWAQLHLGVIEKRREEQSTRLALAKSTIAHHRESVDAIHQGIVLAARQFRNNYLKQLDTDIKREEQLHLDCDAGIRRYAKSVEDTCERARVILRQGDLLGAHKHLVVSSIHSAEARRFSSVANMIRGPGSSLDLLQKDFNVFDSTGSADITRFFWGGSFSESSTVCRTHRLKDSRGVVWIVALSTVRDPRMSVRGRKCIASARPLTAIRFDDYPKAFIRVLSVDDVEMPLNRIASSERGVGELIFNEISTNGLMLSDSSITATIAFSYETTQ